MKFLIEKYFPHIYSELPPEKVSTFGESDSGKNAA